MFRSTVSLCEGIISFNAPVLNDFQGIPALYFRLDSADYLNIYKEICTIEWIRN